tara:strand:+ start:9430 stop:10107 length:678 start_codon:yes stop_codon:yes gene_type:complete
LKNNKPFPLFSEPHVAGEALPAYWPAQQYREDEVLNVLRGHRAIHHPGLMVVRNEKVSDGAIGFLTRYQPDIMAFYHELAHLLEFQRSDPGRADPYQYRFECKTQIEVNGEEYDQPATCQATQREIRTFAIEYHLLKSHPLLCTFERDTYVDIAAFLCRLMPDFFNVPALPSTEKEKGLRVQYNQPQIDWCAKEINLAIDALSEGDVISLYRTWSDKHLSDASPV